MKEITIESTIEQAKIFLMSNWEDGVSCPCCKQFVKLYKRKLNSGMAATLIHIYHQTKTGAHVHVKDSLREHKLRNGHDWTLLDHWGLLESNPDKDAEWRITPAGIEFVQNRRIVPKTIGMYNSKMYGYINYKGQLVKRNDFRPGIDEMPMTNIIDSLGDHFDYNELMNR